MTNGILDFDFLRRASVYKGDLNSVRNASLFWIKIISGISWLRKDKIHKEEGRERERENEIESNYDEEKIERDHAEESYPINIEWNPNLFFHNHELTEGIDTRIFSNVIFVMLCSQRAEYQSNCNHVLQTVVTISRIANKTIEQREWRREKTTQKTYIERERQFNRERKMNRQKVRESNF